MNAGTPPFDTMMCLSIRPFLFLLEMALELREIFIDRSILTKNEAGDKSEDWIIDFAILRNHKKCASVFAVHLKSPSASKGNAFVRNLSNEFLVWRGFEGQLSE